MMAIMKTSKTKTIGMVGGIGPESTIDYYRLLIAAYRERHPDGSYPAMVINSVDLKTVLDLVGGGERTRLVEFLGHAVEALARAGAEVGFLASNTPHLVFDEVARRSPIPLVSIVASARERASALGLKRVGLFGTRFTMQASFYADSFAEAGIEVVAPPPQEQDYIHEKYMGELVAGILLPETRAGLLKIAQAMKTRDGIEALILGGTELPLILRGGNDLGIPFLDTAQIHVKAVMAAAARL
jgi:aspartate racemase